MKKMSLLTITRLLFIIVSTISLAQADDPYQIRRQKTLDNMAESSLLILQTTEKGFRFGFNFQQDSDLFYLTGSNEKDILLLLAKDGINYPEKNQPLHSVLLIYPPEKQRANKEIYYDSLATALGYDLVASPVELRKVLDPVAAVNEFYTNIIRDRQPISHSILEKKIIKFCERFPDLKFRSPAILISSLRRIKSETEIAALQTAIDITLAAQREAFKAMSPGLFEYQIEAIIEFVFKYSGSQQLSFETIVGAGPNSLILHYNEGSRKIESEDMVVLDIGCEFAHYCADITRTVPASGTFSKEQQEVYNVVLAANQEIIKMLRPGFTMAQMDSIAESVISQAGFGKYILHSCTHYLGLDVHDVGNTREKLVPGCVVTVEPGIYIPPQTEFPPAYWNIGVRIEDDILITENGNRNLSQALPKSIPEIEAIMKMPGMSLSFE